MSERPNLYWRNLVRGGMHRYRPEGPDPEAAFLALVDEHYRAEKLHSHATSEGELNLSLYTLAVALLTYGRLDVVDDLLANLPPVRHPARILARSVSALFPLPDALDPLVDPAAVAAWIAGRRTTLAWSPVEGRFLDTDDI